MNTASILTDIKYGEISPIVNVLINTPNHKEIRIVFRKGQEMKEHKTPYPIVVSVIEGSIDFGVSTERFILKNGMMIALEANILHNLKAQQDSIVRLSLNKSHIIENQNNL
ncbi:cupin domain-containing protein [Elizabethkingia bruuniana]|uniref:Cupin domain-containing protein n=2 Tax=Elizabethkingia TaxID=308865 RepID=A0A7T8A140_9FLAO|nr:cupin domain-containing protein [Elizabethkingia bruuniana]KGO10466.1 cupin [Elizabethkingia miricola]MCT3940486.1 cupin domain-containing protein [Elizabethkingia anophelis]MCT4071366.1 cupin domain-containing protein [Elizabethkingia anophelis]MCT4193598.1 cupin domain-containing protein [Elizabethkingia anophelis]MDV2458243.1 cupin [Elizabethkingia anophelis]